jgi:hypothetical protein
MKSVGRKTRCWAFKQQRKTAPTFMRQIGKVREQGGKKKQGSKR